MVSSKIVLPPCLDFNNLIDFITYIIILLGASFSNIHSINIHISHIKCIIIWPIINNNLYKLFIFKYFVFPLLMGFISCLFKQCRVNAQYFNSSLQQNRAERGSNPGPCACEVRYLSNNLSYIQNILIKYVHIELSAGDIRIIQMLDYHIKWCKLIQDAL